MSYKLAKKAYTIDLGKIDEGYCYSKEIVYAENLNKAKSALLKVINNDNYSLRFSDEEISYLNIPVVRDEESDLYNFEDKELSLYSIDELLTERSRKESLDQIFNDENISHCYILKGMYYRPNWAGYTDFKSRAGVYDKKEAVSHARSVREISIIPIEVETHNEMIEKEISELKSRLIANLQPHS